MSRSPQIRNHSSSMPERHAVPRGIPDAEPSVASFVILVAGLERSPDGVADLLYDILYLFEEFGLVCYEGLLPEHAVERLKPFQSSEGPLARHETVAMRIATGESRACCLIPKSYLDGQPAWLSHIFNSVAAVIGALGDDWCCYEGEVRVQAIDCLRFFRASS